MTTRDQRPTPGTAGEIGGHHRQSPLTSLRRRLHREEGFGLIELLIAMTVLNIGILAVFTGLSSGFAALNRASATSSGAALADAQMEKFRALTFPAICLNNATTDAVRTAGSPAGTAVATCATADPALVALRTPVTGPDNAQYRVDTYVVWDCAMGTLSTASPYSTSAPGCETESVEQAAAIKLVRITVRDTVTTSKVYATEDSAFDETTGT